MAHCIHLTNGDYRVAAITATRFFFTICTSDSMEREIFGDLLTIS